jgi:lipopolysaccharide transport system ATP-binding protein
MTIAIRVENLSKYYRLGLIGGGTLREDMQRKWAKWCGKPDPLLQVSTEDTGNQEGEFIWALRDINFEVKQGEILGIIGRNGAGKSTLLKILSRITAPTDGRIMIKGRVGSLLEVGTGFHPELTGRENIYLNGTILGMTKAEVNRKLEEIVDFAEMAKFIDTPVKRYSSGMKVRLAFSVAAHLEPEILVIDEVLAVGDASFQKKCIGKMGDVASHGRTILFVSHNMLSVRSLCSRGIIMLGGKIEAEGETEAIVSKYLALEKETSKVNELIWQNLDTAPGNELLRVTRFAIEPSLNPVSSNVYVTNEELKVSIDFVCKKDFKNLGATIRFMTREEIVAFATSNMHNSHLREKSFPTGHHKLTCTVYPNLFNSGEYKVSLHFTESGKIFFKLNKLVSFDMTEVSRETGYYGKRAGVLAPILHWESTSS